ncbi:hypothetical protein SinmeB_5225 (plasmid) [Sinorhizobium meliloti BL225C]|nr:hypothetical protein SinmeB_5225 [Sinorhizobium meliloti BL225C]SDZ42359.1 hypothetical protein SAMN04244576_05892 [Sinorhizobium meliloti]
MSQKYSSLIELLNVWFGGAATTMIGAMVGRLMWHTNEVRKMRRKFFGKELLWEMPIAVGMAFIGEVFGVVVGAGATDGNGTHCCARLSRAARVRGAVHAVVCGETRQARLSGLNALLPAASAMGPFCARLSHSISGAKLWTGASLAGGAD